jgi:hypothetical protein
MISFTSRKGETTKMASRSPGGLEWSVSIKPLLIAPNASIDAEILPKLCKSITLRYGIGKYCDKPGTEEEISHYILDLKIDMTCINLPALFKVNNYKAITFSCLHVELF